MDHTTNDDAKIPSTETVDVPVCKAAQGGAVSQDTMQDQMRTPIPSNASPVQGTLSEGGMPEGVVSESVVLESVVPQGVVPQGAPNGAAPQGALSQGAVPEGVVPQGTPEAVCAMPAPAPLFSTWRDKPKNNLVLSALFLALITIFGFTTVFADSYDNDIWFILATGEYIVDNGFPTTNPFSLHEGLDIVVQQWLHCVISYVIYKAVGFVGLGLWVTALFGVLVFSLYRVGRIVRNDSFGSEWILLIAIPILYVMSPYASMRPHLYTMIAFTWIVGLMYLYRQTSKIKWLVPLPFIVLLQANIHTSMAPFDLVIIGCFAIPDFLKPLHKSGYLKKFHFVDSSYPRIPLFVTLAVCALALIANPYTIDGALYVFKSMGAASYANYISEMNPLTPARNFVYAVVTAILVVTAVVVGRMGGKKMDLAMLLLILGCGCLSFTHIRNLWLGPFFCYFYLVWASAGHSIRLLADWKYAKAFACALYAVGLAVSAYVFVSKAPSLASEPENNYSTPVAAMDYLDEIGANKEKTRILNFFNMGGYIEYRGYPVVVDPRPELWSPGITNAIHDYYVEFVDMSNGKTYINDYIARYDLNVYIVAKDDASIEIFKDQGKYLEISGGEGYRAFILRSAYEDITGKDISTAPDAVLRN